MSTYVTSNDAARRESVSPVDDDHRRVAASSTIDDERMNEQADARNSSYDAPIVISSQGESGDVPEFRPFLLGTGYC
eukprot:CAMPEP_0116015260 /NCGR_PEP_ID=MMETSP0321-20121206/6736_1 /TAXON_ID=163516 /ORGANISM="Leptocylindrus danicus var. danicus, Strain B650" /LENGTH=76 /DNA_ID=CAMNT_0003485007 /DNA_START=997 /DNA_END=1227 /DNA_ORIENTATION=+